MNGLFSAVKNWALNVSRQGPLELQPVDRRGRKVLYEQVPCFEDGTSKQKMHALIAMFSNALVCWMDARHIFGSASAGPIASATNLFKAFDEIPSATKQRKKQWAILTNEILSKNIQASIEASHTTLANFITYIESALKVMVGPSFDSNSLPALRTAIEPFMPIVFALQIQEAEYRVVLLSAINNGVPRNFDAIKMEDVFGEEKGILQASVFPAVFKEVMKGSDKVEHIVICRGKVVIAP
ncbi:hypothetical protein D6C86_07245 [Aureobasidium pullulans]|uniref:Uncharacterized protein n=1 Tax=Aureobasidium pullulans TaxID=5580 RepID=A0A4S9Q390_AURPU|nr:hypothetical protein D6C94_01840 [Aureobasidium pullulans]THZ57239.1 hypothetical protein D6C86_07245 [Aureobasidium pullulans]